MLNLWNGPSDARFLHYFLWDSGISCGQCPHVRGENNSLALKLVNNGVISKIMQNVTHLQKDSIKNYI